MKEATKKKRIKKRATECKTTTNAQARRKYTRGGRIEAYTMGEALGKKKWP